MRKVWPSAPDRDPVETISPRTTTAVLVAIVVFLYFVRTILLPFVIPGAVAYVSTPLVERLARLLRVPRWTCAVAVFLVLLSIALTLGYFAVPPFIHELVHIATDVNGIAEEAARRVIGDRTLQIFGQSMNAAQIGHRITDIARGWLGQSQLLTLAVWGFGGTFSVFLMLVLLFYFLVGGPQISAGLFRLIPPKQRPLIELMWVQVDPILRRYFIGIAVVVAYASSAAYIGLGLVLGLRHAVLLALLTGLLEMIPVVGPASSAIIAGLAAIYSATGTGPIIAYAVYATVLRLSIDQLVGPLVLGTAARVHPVMVIFCFLTGGILFGVAGVILAIPVALTIKVVLATLYEEPPEEESQVPESPAS